MSIKFTDGRRISTLNTMVPWDTQAQASMAFFFRYENTGTPDPGTCYIISRGLAPYYVFTGDSATPGMMTLKFNVNSETTGKSILVTLSIGTTYHFAMTWDQGHQILYTNGIPYEFGTLTGNTKGGVAWPCDFGAASVPAPTVVYTLDNFALWNGYVLTPADVAGLRDGSLTPAGVGGSATWRGHWSFAGTPGNTVVLNDPGIANSFSDTAYDLKTFTGTGTAVYSAPLVFEPAVDAAPMVMTSGETIGFRLTTIGAGTPTYATAALIPPTVKKNGASIGSLANPFMQANNPVMLWTLPPGQVIGPGDTVTVSAPVAWANTPAGITSAMADLPAANKAGKSAYGVDTLSKTFKPGWNGAHLGFQSGGVYSFTKNWRYRCQDWSGGTVRNANGKPTSNTSFTSSNSLIWSVGPQNNFDQTMSFPSGLWAVGWDDTNPAQPTTLSLITSSPLLLSVTPRPDLSNPGTGGVGIVSVFDIQQISTIPQDAGANAKCAVKFNIDNPTKTYSFTNDVVYGPGDFTPESPTVLDRSDPYALSHAILERFANGVGSLRYIDVFWGYGGMGSESEPEHAYRLTDYSWGLYGGKVLEDAFFTSARPWNPAVTPYLYSTLFGHFGEEYDCNLGTAIDAVTTVLNITDAATAPVIYGLRIKAGTELMRVLDATGTAVTVERGTCGTTPAVHATGTLKVQYRWNTGAGGVNIPAGQLAELVAATPHKMNAMRTSQAYGPWPNWVFTDASKPPSGTNIANWKFPVYPTGANTVLMYLPGNQVPWVTLSTTYTQSPGTCWLAGKWPSGPAAPVEFGAKMAGHFDGCALHFSLPHCTTDSLAWAGWRWVRDNLPADRHIFFEYSNEPWNYIFNEYTPLQNMAAWLYPGGGGYEFYVQRMTEIVAIGRQVWTAAGRDPSLIHGGINNQKGDTGGVATKLAWAKTTLGYPIDYASIATYMQFDATTTTQIAYWSYNDNQALDLCMALFRGDPTGYTAVCANMNTVINAYNTTHGEDCRLYGYEGGMTIVVPALTTTFTASIDASQTTVAVASSAGFVAGTPILCGTEWMTVTGTPTSTTMTVTRGAYGSTAATHANAASIRTAWMERSHDLMYSPLAYFLEQEHYALLQEQLFVAHNTYALSMGSAEPGTAYGAYRIQTQVPGYGDGSDGKLDNRLTLACPGKPNTKGPLVDQDAHAVSVRGQAFLDWMEEVTGLDETVAIQNVRLPFGKYRRRA